MANNSKIIKIDAPQPTVASGEHAFYMYVYDPDSGQIQVQYVSLADADWKVPANIQAAMCDVNPDLEFCP